MEEFKIFNEEETKQIKETMAIANIPGVSIAYLHENGEIDALPMGFTEPKSQEKVTEKTVFGAASLSKVVFAYLVLKLIQNNELSFQEDLDAILSFGNFCKRHKYKYAPSLENIKLNITSILSHTTGLDDVGGKGIKYQTIPGNYWYSGYPLYYLQKVIETKTGEKLEKLAKKHVFSSDACNMPNSTFRKENRAAFCANSLFTTAEDYASFVKKWINDDNEIMASAFIGRVNITTDKWANTLEILQNDLKKINWGLGWGLELDHEGNTAKAYHSGDMNNWRAWVAVDINKKTAIIYFANSENGHILADQIISPHITFNHVFSYFSQKYGFALTCKEEWEKEQEDQFKKIGQFLESHSDFVYTEPSSSHVEITRRLNNSDVAVQQPIPEVAVTENQERTLEVSLPRDPSSTIQSIQNKCLI